MKTTEIFSECMNILGIALLQQFQVTTDETTRDVIGGMFIACLVLIVASNLSFVGLKIRYRKNCERIKIKVEKTDKHYQKVKIRKSIDKYAKAATVLHQDVNIMNINLPSLYADKRRSKKDAKIA